MDLPLKRTKKITEAQYGYCEACERFLGSPYWDLSKTRWMHERGTGHKLTLYVVDEPADAYMVLDWLDNGHLQSA